LEIQKLLQSPEKNKRVSTWIKLIYCFGLSLPEIQKSIYGKKPEDYLFEGRKGKIHPRTIQKALEKFCCSLGICFSIRKLSNILIYDLYKHGWDDKSIAFQLGLSSARFIKKFLMFLDVSSIKPHPLDKIFKKRV